MVSQRAIICSSCERPGCPNHHRDTEVGRAFRATHLTEGVLDISQTGRFGYESELGLGPCNFFYLVVFLWLHTVVFCLTLVYLPLYPSSLWNQRLARWWRRFQRSTDPTAVQSENRRSSVHQPLHNQLLHSVHSFYSDSAWCFIAVWVLVTR